MRPLRIGVNALYLIPGGVGGTEIYLRNLLGALAEIDAKNEYIIFQNRETGTGLAPQRPNFHVAEQPVRAVIRPARLLWEQTVLPVEVARRRLDVLFNPGFTAPVLGRCANVTVFHDMQHKRHPEYFRWFDLPFWRLFIWAAAHRSDMLLAVSEATRADVLRFYRVPEWKVRTVPHGVSPRFLEIAGQRDPGHLDRFILCVSTLHPHKNLVALIRAFAAFRRGHPDFRLVIAGFHGFHADQVRTAIAGLGLESQVRLTGWIPREELLDLYRRACAFVYPSTFEGFGMPVLEALAAGIPTACSAIEPLSGIAGQAALQFDPADEGAIASTLSRLVSDMDLREKLAQSGPARAAGFTWRKTAEATLQLLRDAAH